MTCLPTSTNLVTITIYFFFFLLCCMYFKQWSTDNQQMMNIMNHDQLPTQTMAEKIPQRIYILLGIVNWKYVTYEHIQLFF